MDILYLAWIVFQIVVGYNLVLPFLFFLCWKITGKFEIGQDNSEKDFAIIVTAYQYTHTLNATVQSILRLNHTNYMVYVVADNCDIQGLNFNDPRVILLRPEVVLASNTRSHQFAIENFVRQHQYLTIIDSDNILHAEFLNHISLYLNSGFAAVQGKRDAKNLNNTLSRLDAVRDIYYHFFDGRVLFDLGSSATLSGSGMAFSTNLYKEFLGHHDVKGAGFDKVLQNFIVTNNNRIAFSEYAVVFDEKTSRPDQLINQRSRWINTWFKYFRYGLPLFLKGCYNFKINQFLFGLILLRPPLFIFLILSGFCMFINIWVNMSVFLIWIIAFALFFLGFIIALNSMRAERKLYLALAKAPKFIFLQIISLIRSRRANQNSVSTRHYFTEDLDKH